MIKIDSSFESANIEVVEIQKNGQVFLKIKEDAHAHFFQWFYFAVKDAENIPLKLHLTNAGNSTFPRGWENYQVFISPDADNWTRIPTQYDGKELIIDHTPTHPTVYFAYFTPYTEARHEKMITFTSQFPHAHVEILGKTIEQRPLHLITIGVEDPTKKKCWIIARQHAGETMAEWYCEGLIQQLLNMTDENTRRALEKMTFYIVPNMNPDGSARGHIRANALGIDLNRQWNSAVAEKTPEITCVLEKMSETGVDFFFDVHGDEARPYVYTIDTATDQQPQKRLLEIKFKQAYQEINGDFQTLEGYPLETFPPGAFVTLAAPVIAERFNCVAMILEMPFQDCHYRPDPILGWTAERSIKLGADLVPCLLAIVNEL